MLVETRMGYQESGLSFLVLTKAQLPSQSRSLMLDGGGGAQEEECLSKNRQGEVRKP